MEIVLCAKGKGLSMLLIGMPRSATTSTIKTLGLASGRLFGQSFGKKVPNRRKKVSFKNMYTRSTKDFPWLAPMHSDMVDFPISELDRFQNSKKLYKQHVPPTEAVLNWIIGGEKRVVILLRNPECVLKSYQKLGYAHDNPELAFEDIKLFYNRYSVLSKRDHVKIIYYDDMVKETVKTVKSVMEFWRLFPVVDLNKIKLAEERLAPDRRKGSPIIRPYVELLKGKRVALIGPAKTIVGKKIGKEIDKYDIVIRMKQPIVPDELKPDYGTRTDVIYTNLNKVSYGGPIPSFFELWKAHGLKWVVMARRKKERNRRFADQIRKFFKYRRSSKAFYRKCKTICNCAGKNIPFTGTVAILDLLSMPFKELFIAGFDFFDNPKKAHYEGYNTDEFEKRTDYNKHKRVVYSLGVNLEYRHSAINDIKGVKKTIEAYKKKGKNIIVDYETKKVLEKF